ncbi:hypothetical protein NDU88_001569 [Pleurodeles waltl]|uniref:Uncharacterized protein n=1 Tax=Pleurodeles waltl TaxID=8319 RepID=A0AAV7SZT3_PLEWA|nr:hypothetical protein NDU88_001569 [Pleurodeles waltl]
MLDADTVQGAAMLSSDITGTAQDAAVLGADTADTAQGAAVLGAYTAGTWQGAALLDDNTVQGAAMLTSDITGTAQGAAVLVAGTAGTPQPCYGADTAGKVQPCLVLPPQASALWAVLALGARCSIQGTVRGRGLTSTRKGIRRRSKEVTGGFQKGLMLSACRLRKTEQRLGWGQTGRQLGTSLQVALWSQQQ